MFLHPRFNHSIKFVFTSYSIGSVNGIPDGKTEKSFCSSEFCLQYKTDLPFKRTFNPYSKGYDCGDKKNWIIGEYSRIHRDIDIINAMREWLYSTPEKNLTEEELYSNDITKAEDCDEKCLICNEESKKENKCILCDSNNDYFPVREKEGLEEYYECYKKDDKIERLYYNKKERAFLPCYETCKYCNELGNIYNHKCTECDYNLIKKTGTKDSDISFNCIIACTYRYYYTESGQYKCTNGPICPSIRNIYVEETKKCVSSCKDETPFIYLYNGNCVKQCPSGYINDEENNICKLIKNDQCSLDAKIENINYLYSQNMFNSFVKRYKDEFTYTDKHITYITSFNSNIIIFKDFECLKQLNLKIPDIRDNTNSINLKNRNKSESISIEDSCYIKVQKTLNIKEKLIVVFFEDKNNSSSIKGYLLYNPFTSEKINFEYICEEKSLIKKEDINKKSNKFCYLWIVSQNEIEYEDKKIVYYLIEKSFL